jgi:hypothetical protein
MRHAVIGRANANLWRALRKAGKNAEVWPVAIFADQVYYLSDRPDAATLATRLGLPIGTGLGEFKIVLDAMPTGGLAPVWDWLTAGDKRRAVEIFSAATTAAGADPAVMPDEPAELEG